MKTSLKTLYHGSPVVVSHPSLEMARPGNDYGRGFYCTENEDLAHEWACTEGADGWANRYELRMNSLRVLSLKPPVYTVLNWLAVLVANREVRLHAPVMRRGAEWLLANHGVDLSQWDVVVGWRADDSYFSFVRSFLANTITIAQLERAMRLGKLGEQVVLKSERAFAALRFVSADPVPWETWYTRRRNRDLAARAAFEEDEARGDPDGLTIRDLMEGRAK